VTLKNFKFECGYKSLNWQNIMRRNKKNRDNIFTSSRSNVLNSNSIEISSSDIEIVADEIKMAMNRFKSKAFSDDGNYVDFANIKDSDDYKKFKEECNPNLRYVNLADLKTREEQLAFWLNIYNSLIINAVIEFNVQKSVTEGLFGIFKFFRQAAYDIGGLRFSLEEIEHGVLRANAGHPYMPWKQFRVSDPRLKYMLSETDPRIHFALNCASESCPPISVYSAENINSQLDLAASNFVSQNVRIGRDRKNIIISKIFQWYKNDFGGNVGVLKFLENYLPYGERRKLIMNNGNQTKIKYQNYDWHLNQFVRSKENAENI
jgi:hypothetical protein